MVMQLRRRATGALITDAIYEFGTWDVKYPDPILETVTGVTYMQKRGRMEWILDVTFVFCDTYNGASGKPYSPIANMYLLQRLARNLEWLRFTDKFGLTYDVRLRGKPDLERDGNSPQVAIYYVDATLLMAGYE